MPAVLAKHAYSRAGVCRLLGVSDQQLRSWTRQGLAPDGDSFSFSDLLMLKALSALKKKSVPASRIRAAVKAVQDRLQDLRKPLTDVRVYAEGRHIQVQFGDKKMEPLTGQLLFNFDKAELSKLVSFPTVESRGGVSAETKNRRAEAERWFEKGLELEHASAPFEAIVQAYEKAAELDPTSAGALVNLGTVYFNARSFREAEALYRKALEIDPNYALAHFNLGNLFDERGDTAKALFHYQAALRLHPHYADAHYNLALLHQSANEILKAVQHWTLYLKIDPNSSWSAVARRELAKLRESTIVRGPKPTK